MANTLFPALVLFVFAVLPALPAGAAERVSAAKAAIRSGRARATQTTRSGDSGTTTANSLELFQSGEAAMKQGDFARAEACFKMAWARETRKATLETPVRRKLTVYVGLAYQNANAPEQAMEFFRGALARDPKYPLNHYFLAVSIAFYEMSQYQAAAEKAADNGTPVRRRPAADEIFEELRRAYLLKENLNPGEKIPNPRTDMFLSQLRHDSRFEKMLAEAGPAADPDLAADLDELAKSGEDASEDMRAAVVEEIEVNRPAAAEILLRRMGDQTLTEAQRAATIWALGRTGDPRAAVGLAHELYIPEFLPLKGVMLEALSRIGGPTAGATLLAELRDAKEDSDRFQILTLLANMEFEPALPLMMDLLRLDTERAANQMAYCFGKMGDKAVPALLNKIADPDKTTRINAINMIAWLCPSRGMIPLQKQYAQERDPEVRLAFMGVLNQLMRPDQFEVFLRTVLKVEPDREAQSVMREKLDGLAAKKGAFEKFKQDKVSDRNLWLAAYGTLFKSFGRAGTLDDLAHTSTVRDEADLVRLRSRVLDRQSEESLADYMKINRIIAWNRMIEESQPAGSNVTVERVGEGKSTGSGSGGGNAGWSAVPRKKKMAPRR